MRIRKHAKISALSFSHAPIAPCLVPTLQTNVCELNRSPWDVMAFAPQSDIFYPEEFQVEGEDSVTANGSGGDSVGAVESVASLKISWDEEQKWEAEDDESRNLLSPFDAEKRDSEIGSKKEEESFICCNKTDGKGWQCRREAKEGHSLCEHHLTQLRSYHSYNYSSHRKSDKVAETSAGVRRRSRGKTSKGSSEYYYYSGFGPLWGKKRNGGSGERGEVKKREMENDAEVQTNPSSSSHIILEHDDDLDDDDDDDSDTGRKRIRKPVKARSLKSLM